MYLLFAHLLMQRSAGGPRLGASTRSQSLGAPGSCLLCRREAGATRLARESFFFDLGRMRGAGFEGGGLFFAQSFEGAVREPADVPAIDVFVGEFPGGVVAARQSADLMTQAGLLEGVDHLQRVLAGKGEVVVSVDD